MVFDDSRFGPQSLGQRGASPDDNTRDMIWNVPRLVEYRSHIMTLKAGDLLSTGTLDGVGPHRLGDQVIIEVERVRRMSVRVELLRP